MQSCLPQSTLKLWDVVSRQEISHHHGHNSLKKTEMKKWMEPLKEHHLRFFPWSSILPALSGLTANKSYLALSDSFCSQYFLEAEWYISCPFTFGLIHSAWCLRFSAMLSYMSEFLSLWRLSNTPFHVFWNCLTVSMNPSHNLWKLKLKIYL